MTEGNYEELFVKNMLRVFSIIILQLSYEFLFHQRKTILPQSTKKCQYRKNVIYSSWHIFMANFAQIGQVDLMGKFR